MMLTLSDLSGMEACEPGVRAPDLPAGCRGAVRTERLDCLCRGGCYHPSDQRHSIERSDVVRIRPQHAADEAVGPLLEDPWKVLCCDGDPVGCGVVSSDPEFADAGRARATTYGPSRWLRP
jgi:hypothetical protein